MPSVPEGAVIGGNELNDLYSVIKAKTEFGELPGKYAIGRGAHVSYAARERRVENFEVSFIKFA